MRSVRFTIPGAPRAKGRPRFSRPSGRTYTDDVTAVYENLVRLAAQTEFPEPFASAVSINLRFRLVPAASSSRKQRERMLAGLLDPVKRPDLDNLAKTVLDGLNGVAFIDDAQVVRLFAEKIYADTAGCDVHVMEV
jgi:Holliday junction resolvase RusA-like endonuclease